MTQHGAGPPEILIEHAKGAYLYPKEGEPILDGIASWWVNLHGHAHPHIARAIQHQTTQLEQVIFAGFTHPKAEEYTASLLEKVHATLGDHLQYVFYSDSGSTAVEVALKMALAYFQQQGQPRYRIVALDGAYHGDTFGAMSVGERGIFNQRYAPLLFDVTPIPFPTQGNPDAEAACLRAFGELLTDSSEPIAALIVEPLVQGSAGMRMYSPEVLARLFSLCKQNGVLTIADEVMTGFGRTGTFFACEQAKISPDLMCLSKGITSGFLPMGATLASASIYDAFYHADRAHMFFHSTSFTGNALALAAAQASLEVWENEPVQEAVNRIGQQHQQAVQRFKNHPQVRSVRSLGTLFALDIHSPSGQSEGYLSDLTPRLYQWFIEHRVLLRPIGSTVYVLPPYCIAPNDLEHVYDLIDQALNNCLGPEASCVARPSARVGHV